MNSGLNSDSEQCTESKLGRVHSAHTHGPSCMHVGRALRLGCAHAVRWVPCCGTHWRRIVVVSQAVSHVHVVVSSPPPVMIQKLYRDPTPATRRVAALYRSLAAPYRHTKGHPHPRYKLLYRDSPHGQAACARVAARP